MKNKTLGLWLMWTLVGGLIAYFIMEDLCGLLMIANWVLVFIAGFRLVNIKDKKQS